MEILQEAGFLWTGDLVETKIELTKAPFYTSKKLEDQFHAMLLDRKLEIDRNVIGVGVIPVVTQKSFISRVFHYFKEMNDVRTIGFFENKSKKIYLMFNRAVFDEAVVSLFIHEACHFLASESSSFRNRYNKTLADYYEGFLIYYLYFVVGYSIDKSISIVTKDKNIGKKFLDILYKQYELNKNFKSFPKSNIKKYSKMIFGLLDMDDKEPRINNFDEFVLSLHMVCYNAYNYANIPIRNSYFYQEALFPSEVIALYTESFKNTWKSVIDQYNKQAKKTF